MPERITGPAALAAKVTVTKSALVVAKVPEAVLSGAEVLVPPVITAAPKCVPEAPTTATAVDPEMAKPAAVFAALVFSCTNPASATVPRVPMRTLN